MCLHQMAVTAANPESRLRSQEDHQRYPHRPGLPADAQEHVPHYCSQEVSVHLLLSFTLVH